jgi:plasmid maintenance system antidote protein VapI
MTRKTFTRHELSARPPSRPVLPELAAELARRGMTHRHLAEAVGVGPQYVTRMIAGREPVSIPMRAAIPAALGMEADELFDSDSSSAEVEGRC